MVKYLNRQDVSRGDPGDVTEEEKLTPTKRRLLTILVVAALLAGVGAIAYSVYANKKVDNAAQVIGTMENATPSTSAEPYKQDAVRAHTEYPEYYQCHNYPADADLVLRNLVPTDNVVATVTYDPHKGKYVVDNDPRITIHEKDAAGNQPTQVLTFDFQKGVRYFATYVHYADGGGLKWGAIEIYGAQPTPKGYSLTVRASTSQFNPAYVIIASDTRTCHAGTVPVPIALSWEQIAKVGLLLPEYSGRRIHPQG